MKKIKIGALLITMVFTLGLLSGCAAKNKKTSQVKIAYFANITHSQALLQRDDGSLQKALGTNTKIKWEKFSAGSTEVESLLAGEVDIGYIGPGPAINAYTKSNGDIRVIAGAADAGAILVSRKNVNIKSVKDLKNRRVAIPQYGNTQDLSLRILLSENGLKDKAKGGNVEIVEAENSDIKTLLAKGSIDAALVPEPWGTRLVQEVGAKVVLNYKDIWRNGEYPTAIVVARKQFIKEHPDIVQKFVENLIKETDKTNGNESKAEDAINRQLKEVTGKGLSKKILNSSFKRIKVTNDPEKEAIIEMADWSYKVGFIKSKANLKDMFDLSFLNKEIKK
ncbi:aliphatic sulfonate ABC transporter substrate-binding protein [Clostridium felsineum]|uniref:Aliphatic sulfonates-binding protein n=1 Tax=Clostridium felsineum TaxID=36839 RepID=A0A1S8MBL8_9CLOT|nr:aliphatic sulfonate ABC transporter substrate-binding protein [Clostridium felsineum]URZ08995.1 Putative aliphatic sulfonates-binding protein [Clostridium felsineum]URZ09623.1 Putative aliphatic sulfonates-binding protein [Clostridium felsineum]